MVAKHNFLVAYSAIRWKAIPFVSVYVFLSTCSESTSISASVETNSLQQIEIRRQEELTTVFWKIIIFFPNH